MYADGAVIYADILFLINFSLDFLCLFISGRLLNRGGKTKRLLCGAFIGALYAFVPYIFEPTVYISLPLHLLSAGLICYIAFGKNRLKNFLITAGTFIVSSALIGGLVTAIFNMSQQYSNGRYTEISAGKFCLICIFSAVIALSYGLICRKKIYIRSAEIRIYIKEEYFDLRLLADSGNLVTEPFSSLPVIIISSAALPYPYDNPESDVFPLPIRAIPISTSAGKGCFFGFRPDKIELKQLSHKPQRIDAYIGIDTGNNRYSGYDGLMPTSLL